MAGKTTNQEAVKVTIPMPNLQRARFRIRGDAPFVQHRFSVKAKEMMIEKQMAGSTGKKGGKREAKDFDACYLGAMYETEDGKHGIPAAAFRCAMISACKIVGFHMTKAKLAVFITAQGFDKDDGTPLVLFTKGEPRKHEAHVRLETGVADIRVRPMWMPGWEADLEVHWDGDIMTQTDIANLLNRAGMQVGVGEGRPDSKKSTGMGWGTFMIVGPDE